jgi:AcrR family transcriptional regulator
MGKPKLQAVPKDASHLAMDVGRASLTPTDWVQAATAMLVNQGVDAVRVDVLARQLGVTRGSFYWHFKDRDHLLRALLQAWREQTTEILTRRLEGASSDAMAQLRDVLSLPHRGRSAQSEAHGSSWPFEPGPGMTT